LFCSKCYRQDRKHNFPPHFPAYRQPGATDLSCFSPFKGSLLRKLCVSIAKKKVEGKGRYEKNKFFRIFQMEDKKFSADLCSLKKMCYITGYAYQSETQGIFRSWGMPSRTDVAAA
jgi:hypothetical protein